MDRNKTIIELLMKVQLSNPYATNFYIPPRLSKSLYSHYYILDDIRLAKVLAKKIESLLEMSRKEIIQADNDIINGLWYSLIAIYGRCFTSNRGLSSLEKSIFKNEPTLIKIHEGLMNKRNSFVAHREDTNMFESVVVLTVPMSEEFNYRVLSRVQRRSFEEGEMGTYVKLLDFLLIAIGNVIEKKGIIMLKKIKEMDPEMFATHTIESAIRRLLKLPQE